MSVQLTILVGYIVLLYAISWYATQLVKRGGGGALNYLLAGRHFPTVVVATMITGLAVGGASTVGVAEGAYTQGLSAGWYNAAWGAGGIIVGLLVAEAFRRMEVRTIPEMMERMYGSSARLVSIVAQLLIMMVITSLQYVAGGAILAALLPSIFTFQQGVLLTALVFVGITLIGGYWAAGLANVINVILIYIGVVVALFFSFSNFGGFDAIASRLPAGGSWFHPISGVGLSVVVAWMVVMITQTFSVQAISQIAFAAKDGRAARRGFIIGGIITLPAGFLCAFFGIIAAAQFPGLKNAAMALPTLVTQITPLVGGLLLAALWAADISTAVGLLLGCSTLVTEDFLKRLMPGMISPKREVLISRLAVLLVSAATLWLALTSVGILKTVTTALAMTSSFTLLILANIYVPSLCRKVTGFWTILASVLVWLAWTWLPAVRIVPHVIYLEWPVCLVVFALCAVLSREPAEQLIKATAEAGS